MKGLKFPMMGMWIWFVLGGDFFLAEPQEVVGKVKALEFLSSQRRKDAESAEFLSEIFSFSQEILLIIQRFLINNVRYQTSTLRSPRPRVSARVIVSCASARSLFVKF